MTDNGDSYPITTVILDFWSPNQQTRQNEVMIDSSSSNFLRKFGQEEEKNEHTNGQSNCQSICDDITNPVNNEQKPILEPKPLNSQQDVETMIRYCTFFSLKDNKTNEIDTSMIPSWGLRNRFYQKVDFRKLVSKYLLHEIHNAGRIIPQSYFLIRKQKIQFYVSYVIISIEKLSQKLLFRKIRKEEPFYEPSYKNLGANVHTKKQVWYD